MDIKMFKIYDGSIGLCTHKLKIRFYENTTKSGFSDRDIYCDADEYKEWTEQLIPKHQLYELIEDEELDTSKYAWMDGIKLRTDNHVKEIEEIAACGSLEAYEATLPESRDAFEVETDYRLSMLELGI